jgi:hypothetical protein
MWISLLPSTLRYDCERGRERVDAKQADDHAHFTTPMSQSRQQVGMGRAVQPTLADTSRLTFAHRAARSWSQATSIAQMVRIRGRHDEREGTR